MKAMMQAAKAAVAAMAVLACGAASAVDAEYGQLNLSYLNYDCWGGSCRIAGNILDKKPNDGCVFMQTWQGGNGNNWAPQTRICYPGGYRYFDFYLPVEWGPVSRVLLASEWKSPVIAWQR